MAAISSNRVAVPQILSADFMARLCRLEATWKPVRQTKRDRQDHMSLAKSGTSQRLNKDHLVPGAHH